MSIIYLSLKNYINLEKGCLLLALMRYEKDYHEYYFTADNKVHPTDGGIHLDQPYYTNRII